jgi:hypothetical protein
MYCKIFWHFDINKDRSMTYWTRMTKSAQIMIGGSLKVYVGGILCRLQMVTSSSCDRNWNSYSFVYNKSRNRLQLKWTEDLVYIYTNSRLMARGKEKDKKKWYVDNVDLEDSNSTYPQHNILHKSQWSK